MEEVKFFQAMGAGGEGLQSQTKQARCVLTMEVEPASAPVRCRTSPPPRILVVEHELDIRRLNAEVLKNFGYKVDTAEDGMAGWETLHAVRHVPAATLS